ncbi:MAG: hypothetical protein V1905_01735 [bacterium]
MAKDQEEQISESTPEITAEQLGAVTGQESEAGSSHDLEQSQDNTDSEGDENNEDDSENDEEETPEKISENQLSMVEKLTSPEAFVMIPTALLLDCIGFALILVALDDFGIMDIVGICTIGVWTFFRSKGQEMTVSKSAKEKTEKAMVKIGEKAKKLEQKFPKATKWAKRLKWLRPLSMGLEFIPYVGAAPLWTICVFLTLIHGNE